MLFGNGIFCALKFYENRRYFLDKRYSVSGYPRTMGIQGRAREPDLGRERTGTSFSRNLVSGLVPRDLRFLCFLCFLCLSSRKQRLSYHGMVSAIYGRFGPYGRLRENRYHDVNHFHGIPCLSHVLRDLRFLRLSPRKTPTSRPDRGFTRTFTENTEKTENTESAEDMA